MDFRHGNDNHKAVYVATTSHWHDCKCDNMVKNQVEIQLTERLNDAYM